MAGTTITRANLTDAVYQEVGLSRNESAELVETVLSEITEALARGDVVKVSSFGSFSVRHKVGASGAIRKPARKCRSCHDAFWFSAPATS